MRPIHFELTAIDPERAINFYQKVFGWKIVGSSVENYWLIDTGNGGPGINGGLMPRKSVDNKVQHDDGINSPEQAINYLITINIKSLDQILLRVDEYGGDIIREKMDVPGVGYLAYCKDTEGNIFGLMEEYKA